MDAKAGNADRQEWISASTAILTVVVTILLVFALVSVPRPGSNMGRESKIKSTKVQVSNFETSLDAFKIVVGRYPDMAEGLRALVVRPVKDPGNWERPFAKSIPLDPWGNEYQYVYPGTHNKDSYDLFSFGPDGKPGGGDDIVNWEEPAKP